MSTLQYVRDTSTNKNRVLEVDSSCKLSVNDAAAQSSLSLINGKITTCDTSNIEVVASALPSGASTSALQTSANSTLSDIDSKLGGTLTTSAGVSRASGNLAVASSVTSGDVSASVDANSYKNIAVFGNLGASGDVEIQVSNDNSNWYTSDKQIYSNYSSYDLYGSFQCDARYIRVKYNITGTITIRYALMA